MAKWNLSNFDWCLQSLFISLLLLQIEKETKLCEQPDMTFIPIFVRNFEKSLKLVGFIGFQVG